MLWQQKFKRVAICFFCQHWKRTQTEVNVSDYERRKTFQTKTKWAKKSKHSWVWGQCTNKSKNRQIQKLKQHPQSSKQSSFCQSKWEWWERSLAIMVKCNVWTFPDSHNYNVGRQLDIYIEDWCFAEKLHWLELPLSRSLCRPSIASWAIQLPAGQLCNYTLWPNQ